MKKILFSFVLLSYLPIVANCPDFEKKYRTIYFYTYGLPAYSDGPGTCRYAEAAKMGFGFKTKAGCVIRPLKLARLEAHNSRMEKKMTERFGEDWHAKYDAALANCTKSH